MRKEEYRKIFEMENKHWWYVGMRRISEVLLGLPLKNRGSLMILDAGCGTGGMIIVLQDHGQVYGIDSSLEAIKYCQKRGLINVSQSSVEKIPFKDNHFDLVICLDVLYHQWVKNDLFTLKEFYRVIKPGGFLLIRVPAYNWLRGKHDEIVATKHRYTSKELKEKTISAGFVIKRVTYANTFLLPFAIIKRLSEKLLPKDTSSDIKPLPPLINYSLSQILFTEAKIISRFNLPFGLSLFCLAKKDD